MNDRELSKLKPEDRERVRSLLRLIAMPASRMTSQELKQAREAAGLSVPQAAKILRCSQKDLRGIEGGFWRPHDAMAERMNVTYGLSASAELSDMAADQLRKDNEALRRRLAVMERLSALALLETNDALTWGGSGIRHSLHKIRKYLEEIPGINLVAARIQAEAKKD
jgi:DNA-binding transcriptional regulator YiaG